MIRSLLLVFGFITATTAYADVQCPRGPKFKEKLTVTDDNGTTVKAVLNGVGLKKVAFFNVFYGALYLEQRSTNAATILNSNQLKVGIIHTLRSISKKQLVRMWNDEYDRLCEDLCDELRPYHNKFLSYARNVKKSESLFLIVFDDRFEFEVNGNEFYDPIYSPEYALLLQRVLIGPDANDKKLEKGLLGKEVICKKV